MKRIYFIKGKNVEVINYYFSIIETAFIRSGWCVEYISDISKIPRNEYILVAEYPFGMKLLMKGYRKIIFWSQGIAPEEDYLNTKNSIRQFLLRICELFVLKNAKLLFLVSDKMKSHYEHKYKIRLKNFVIMPCFNTKYDETVFVKKNYDKNVFCYVGSMANWQSFDKTAAFYKMIEEKLKGDSFLKIYTAETDKARTIVDAQNILHYSIEYVPQQKLLDKLLDCKFGFIIREDNPINNVATPTKMSSYLTAGVIPIFSTCINSFDINLGKFKYVIRISDINDIKKVVEFCKRKIDIKEIKDEYLGIFNSYYNEEYYIRLISNKINLLK